MKGATRYVVVQNRGCRDSNPQIEPHRVFEKKITCLRIHFASVFE